MSNVTRVSALLGLRGRPVAVAFTQDRPEDLPAWDGGPTPAGCAFWREAMAGKSFYTVAGDHSGCAIGCHTHHIPHPDVMPTVEMMVKTGYVAMEEVPLIPTLATTPHFVLYGPADTAAFQPDVVLVLGRPAAIMLLNEACIKAGAHSGIAQTLGRPGCAALPMTLNTGAASLSFGCAGNRLFTGTPEDELFLAIPGDRWAAVADALIAIIEANRVMTGHYRERLVTLRV